MSKRRDILIRAVVGLLCFLVGTVLRWGMFVLFGRSLPYATFYPLVFLAAIIGGWIAVAFVAIPAFLFASVFERMAGLLWEDIPLGALFLAVSFVAAWIGEIYLRKSAVLRQIIHSLQQETERRAAAEEALAEQIRLFESAPELARFGVFQMDIRQDLCRWPSSSSRLLGKPPEDTTMTIKEALSLVAPEDRDRVSSELTALTRDGITRKTEYVLVRPDGQRRFVKTVAKLARNRQGDPIIIGTILDTTDEWRLHFQLNQREEEYRQLVENQIAGIGLVDANERILYMNPAGLAMFGLCDYHGRTITEFLPPHELSRVRAETESRATGANNNYELDIVTAGGAPRTLLVSAAPRFDEKGEFIATFGVFHDITGRRLMQCDLVDSQEQFRQIANNIPEVSWIIDENSWAIVYASPAFESVFGVPLAKVRPDARRLLDYVHEDDRDSVMQSLRGDPGDAGNTVEFRLLRPDGSRSLIRMQNSRVHDERPAVRRVAGIAADITHERRRTPRPA